MEGYHYISLEMAFWKMVYLVAATTIPSLCHAFIDLVV